MSKKSQKAQHVKETVLDAGVQAKVLKILVEMIESTWRFIYPPTRLSTGKRTQTSSAKTDRLHECCAHALKTSLGFAAKDFDFATETEGEGKNGQPGKTQRIKAKDAYGNDFQLDGVVKDLTGKILAKLLIKAPMQSINKNTSNALANMLGSDVIRSLSKKEKDYLLSIYFCPSHALVRNKEEWVWEETKPDHLMLINPATGETPLRASAIRDDVALRVHEVFVSYDLDLGVGLDEIKSALELGDAIDAKVREGKPFIKVDEKCLPALMFWVQRMLQTSGNEEHSAYLAARAPLLMKEHPTTLRTIKKL